MFSILKLPLMKTTIKSLITFSFVLLLFSCKKESSPIAVERRPIDADGNIYDTITIGTQCWMKSNLKTTHYNDGTPIPTGLSDADWSADTIGAYAVYDNNAVNDSIYGKLYNWYALNTGKLAPAGWHVPTDDELTTLRTYLGGPYLAGGAMKATILWNSPNTGATNSSGFTALPSGFRNYDGSYSNLGNYCYIWSSTPAHTGYARYCALFNSIAGAATSTYNKVDGFAVRCVRN